MQANQIAAPAAVDVDQRQIEDGSFKIDRHLLSCPEGAGAAHQVTGVAVGGFGRTRLDLLATDLAGEFPGGYLAVAVHQDDERPGGLILEDQRFDDSVLINVELACGNLCATMFFVGIQVAGEGNSVCLQEPDGPGFGRVGTIIQAICVCRRLPDSGIFRQGKQQEETAKAHPRDPALKQRERLESAKPVHSGEAGDTAGQAHEYPDKAGDSAKQYQ